MRHGDVLDEGERWRNAHHNGFCFRWACVRRERYVEIRSVGDFDE
jgi:hypothetical protein